MCSLSDPFCKECVLSVFSYAFKQLLTVDHALFEHNATERTIAARVAMHLRQYYFQYETSTIGGKNYFVDVEYNKAGHGLKNPKGTYRSWTAPDIIFHNRGYSNEKDNIFCCELKKDSKSGQNDAEKVKSLINHYNYLYGFDIFAIKQNKICFDLYEKLPQKQGNRKYSLEKYLYTIANGIQVREEFQ